MSRTNIRPAHFSGWLTVVRLDVCGPIYEAVFLLGDGFRCRFTSDQSLPRTFFDELAKGAC